MFGEDPEENGSDWAEFWACAISAQREGPGGAAKIGVGLGEVGLGDVGLGDGLGRCALGGVAAESRGSQSCKSPTD